MSHEQFNTDRPAEREPEREGARTPNIRPATEREIHYDSPTKYDIDFYQRKVNRLETDLSALQEELSLTRFRLQKAEDFEDKYEVLFKQHQNLFQEYEALKDENIMKARDLN